MVVIRPHLSSRAARVSELLSTWCRMWGVWNEVPPKKRVPQGPQGLHLPVETDLYRTYWIAINLPLALPLNNVQYNTVDVFFLGFGLHR